MATRSFTPPVQELLVKLNEANTEVRKVHSSMAKVADLAANIDNPLRDPSKQNANAGTSEDADASGDAAASEDADDSQESKQERRAPKRFGQDSLAYIDHDAASTDVSDSECRNKEDSEFSGDDEEDEKTGDSDSE